MKHSVKIISDGTVHGTRVIDEQTGKDLSGITRVEIEPIDAKNSRNGVTAKLSFVNVKLELTGGAEGADGLLIEANPPAPDRGWPRRAIDERLFRQSYEQEWRPEELEAQDRWYRKHGLPAPSRGVCPDPAVTGYHGPVCGLCRTPLPDAMAACPKGCFASRGARVVIEPDPSVAGQSWAIDNVLMDDSFPPKKESLK